ncbi:MAG: RNA polymerase sigma factor [Fimbriimonas sp.]
MGTADLIAEIHRRESGRVLATLIRLVGDFDLAEDVMQEAFAAAVVQWEAEIPANPAAWLISTARFKAIDQIRRRARQDQKLREQAEQLVSEIPLAQDSEIEDDRLRLIFMCCHPCLSREAQVALTLREVCGLTTEEVARAFLLPTSTLAQRIVRAKAKLREARVAFVVPEADELPERVASVLSVIYLVFNEGYYSSSGESLVRADLSQEAIRLARLVAQLLPEPEVLGLLALMLFHESRRAARLTDAGDIVLLPDQDRSRWDWAMIEEANALVTRAGSGLYALQAAIAAEHAIPSGATDWARVVGLYDLLLAQTGSNVVALNRAVAVSMCNGAVAGLALVDGLLGDGGLAGFGLAHSARADLCRQLGRHEEALAAYERALELATQESERRFLSGRIDQMREILFG